jgi:hypothetical protein
MSRLEHRVRRLEENRDVCNHRSPIVLRNATAECVQKAKAELDNCLGCQQQGRPKLVIFRYPTLN